MKILLVGEYSTLHNSLKEGLVVLGHKVDIVATGDNFKNLPVDFSIAPSVINKNRFTKTLNKAFYRLFKSDLVQLEKGLRFCFLLQKFKNYDLVQLINSNAIETYPVFSRYLLRRLFKQNKKATLLVCGEETPIIEFLQRNTLKYSILTPLLENPKLKKEYLYSTKYLQKNYKKTFDFILQNVSSILTSDLDYKIPMEEMGYKVRFIPNPVNIDKFKFQSYKPADRIVVFMGINTGNSIKKGIVYFEKALKIIREKYKERVEIITTENLPHNEYINCYERANIVLDQVLCYDQGYNALEAMAKGKVVFTGAEEEFYKYYNLKEKVNINSLPDVDYLVNELSYLIENPKEIEAIGKRARAFIEKEHDSAVAIRRWLLAISD